MSKTIQQALSGIPATLQQELLDTFSKIVRNYRENRWEPSELNGGKLCEVVYSILKGLIDGKMPKSSSKPRNMLDACKALEQAPETAFPRSVRIQIPRALVALYEIRNNRGVGHVGGEVNPNHMDARVVLEMSKWILAELVRLFHGSMSPQEATAVVESLVDRTVPMVWGLGEKRRVLDPSLKFKDQTLLLLYAENIPVAVRALFEWVEHSNFSAYKRDVIKPMHKERLIEFDEVNVVLLPPGLAHVEKHLPLSMPA